MALNLTDRKAQKGNIKNRRTGTRSRRPSTDRKAEPESETLVILMAKSMGQKPRVSVAPEGAEEREDSGHSSYSTC